MSDLAKSETQLRKEEAARRLVDKVAAAEPTTLTERVAWILNHFPEARDSDITCQLRYWEYFDAEKYNARGIAPKDLYNLTRLTSISRARAKIQNEYRLFLASPPIRKRRGQLSEEERQNAVEDRPAFPSVAIYADESGKTDKYLIVGSMWISNSFSTITILNEINEIKSTHGKQGELHFKDVRGSDLDLYKDVVDAIHRRSSTISFKGVYVERAGLPNVHAALTYLLYYLVCEGIKHENESGRAPLPRNYQIFKDSEEVGADKMMLSDIRNRLAVASEPMFGGNATFDEFLATDSTESVFIQIVDLFTAAINRSLNQQASGSHAKDKLSEYFFRKFGIEESAAEIEEVGDCVALFGL